jgi:hypothetical protein
LPHQDVIVLGESAVTIGVEIVEAMVDFGGEDVGSGHGNLLEHEESVTKCSSSESCGPRDALKIGVEDNDS